MNRTRREFLVAAGGAVAGVATLSISASAIAREEHQPETVSISYDVETLEQYRPRLVFEEDAREKFLGLYGLLATSPDYESDVAVYWASYSHQEGVTDLDSHYGDHEPIYVYIDSETGEIRRVLYSAYHWIKGETVATDRPRFDVVDPWHHYIPTTQEGDLVDVLDLTEEFGAWLSNGLEESLADGAVVNPWSMRSRSDWWKRGTFGVSSAALYVRLRYYLGLDGAGRAEL